MCTLLDVCLSTEAGLAGKSAGSMPGCYGDPILEKYPISHCQEKSLWSKFVPVPQTDTGR